MAIELARYKGAVRIIDKAPERSDKFKALITRSRTLELLEYCCCPGAVQVTDSMHHELRR
ncbi:MAG: hypothetical protein DMG70_10875 [Acidobacteria bacterium]|nr:MAG: hypothetical protein DMG70_10875 [Acidobacteriota bacterium]